MDIEKILYSPNNTGCHQVCDDTLILFPKFPCVSPSSSPKASHFIPFPWSKFFPFKGTLLRPKGKVTLLSIL